MRIGVTGSSGLIGTALVQAARERGDSVIRFVRPGTESPESEVIRWNPTADDVDEADLRKVGGLDAVVHLAGAGIADRRWNAERRKEILDSRTRSTELLSIAIAALPSGCPMVASGSAIGYYGSRGDEILAESSSTGSGFLADVCQKWERAADPLRDLGTKVSYLRTGIVMSSRGGALKKQIPLFRLGLGGPLSHGDQWMSPISLADEVRAILWIVDRNLDGPVNLTSPSPLTNRAFTKVLARQLHRPSVVSAPTPALRLMLGADLVDQVILASQRTIPTRLTESGFEFRHPNANAIVHWALTEERGR